MNRRELILAGAGTALANGLLSLGCGAQATSTPPEHGGHAGHEHGGGPAAANPELARRAGECVIAGEACTVHCLTLLGQGDTSMRECSQSVYEMLAVCRAVTALASQGSPRLAALAAICVDTCTACEAACRPHAAHHAACQACAEACLATIAVARTVAA